MTPEMLRAEAAECLKSSQGNGEYNTPFYVAHIVLENLARRLEVAGTAEPIDLAREEPPPSSNTGGTQP